MTDLIQVLSAALLPFLIGFTVYTVADSVSPLKLGAKHNSGWGATLIWAVIALAVSAIVFGGKFVPLWLATVLVATGMIVGGILVIKAKTMSRR